MSRRLLPSPAMVLALAALVLAASGSAIAAKHYLITSTGQISPKVRAKLKGAKGPKGKPGPAGTAGATGATGVTGPAGLGLTENQTLPNGATEVGTYATSADVATGYGLAAIEFRPKLAAPIDSAHVHRIPAGTSPTAECPGSSANPTAAAGHLCFYDSDLSNATFTGVYHIESNAGLGADPHGALYWITATGPQARAWGVWAVRAP